MKAFTHTTESERRVAVFSNCGDHRFQLCICWDQSKRSVQFIGLNPSTATHEKDDPTVRRCKDYARQWGFGGMVMTNLFSYRSTDPRGMKSRVDPNLAENDDWLVQTSQASALVIAAWGNHGSFLDRATEVKSLIPDMKCLGLTGSGHPKHPLYLRKDLKPIPFN